MNFAREKDFKQHLFEILGSLLTCFPWLLIDNIVNVFTHLVSSFSEWLADPVLQDPVVGLCYDCLILQIEVRS